MKPYSVLLLYPDTGNGTETYFTHTESIDPAAAELTAKHGASLANDGIYEPDDFALLGVFDGHIEILRGCYD